MSLALRSLSTDAPRHPAQCPGCGATLQTTNENRLGYVPDKVLVEHQGKVEEYENRPIDTGDIVQPTAAEDDGTFAALHGDVNGLRKVFTRPKPIICARCCSLRQNARVKYMQMSSEEYAEEMEKIRKTRGMILLLVDLFDFPSGLTRALAEMVGPKRPVTLVGNKADLLPTLVTDRRKYESITGFMRRVAEEECDLRVASVHLISGKTGFGVHGLFEEMYRKCRKSELDIVIMGCANAGKSTLVNHLLRDRDRTTASVLPGTTVGSTQFLLQMQAGEPVFAVPDTKKLVDGEKNSNQVRIIDTPGLINRGQIVHMLTPEELTMAIPSKRILPRVFIVKPGQCLFLGGLARIDYEEGDVPAYFTVFASSKMSTHVTQIDKAAAVYNKFAGVDPMLQPPVRTAEDMKAFPPLVPQDFIVRGVGWHMSGKDLVLGGLAWVSFTYKYEGEIRVKAHTPEGTTMYLRDSLDPTAVASRGSRKGDSAVYEPQKRRIK